MFNITAQWLELEWLEVFLSTRNHNGKRSIAIHFFERGQGLLLCGGTLKGPRAGHRETRRMNILEFVEKFGIEIG